VSSLVFLAAGIFGLGLLRHRFRLQRPVKVHSGGADGSVNPAKRYSQSANCFLRSRTCVGRLVTTTLQANTSRIRCLSVARSSRRDEIIYSLKEAQILIEKWRVE
jgi:hypothetical protein